MAAGAGPLPPNSGLPNPAAQAGSAEQSQRAAERSRQDTGSLQRIPLNDVLNRFQKLLNQANAGDPKLQELLQNSQIPARSQQALAVAAYAVVKGFFGRRLKHTDEDEEAILQAIKQEYSEDLEDLSSQISPDERRQRQQKRRKGSKPTVNSTLYLVERCLKQLAKRRRNSGASGLSLQG